MTFPEKSEGEQERPQKTIAPNKRDALNGTTRRVYRYIYKRGPARPHDIQRDLGLSTPSLADYHVQKLLRMKLIREERAGDGSVGYSAEEAVFEAMIRVRRTVIPLRATASVFFAVALALLLTLLRPGYISSTYVFSLVAIAVALAASLYETINGLRNEGM